MIFISCCTERKNPGSEPKQVKEIYTWESLAKRPVPKWFNDAKFGIMIHWGPYSVIGHRRGEDYAEWTPYHMYHDEKCFFYDYFEETYSAQPPEFGYKDIIPLFKAEKWDPDAWAELFHEAGAKYVTLTAEHHDGYALWDSDITEWCTTKTGPMRDLVGDLGKAVRRKGMKYAPSYHRERHNSYFAEEMYVIKSQPLPDIAREIELMPKAADLYGPFELSDAFIQDYVARWKEIEQKYQPDFMWIDDVPIFYKKEESKNHPQIHKYRDAFLNMIGDYFKASDEWGKEVYLNNKGKHKNWPDGPGCLEMDNLQLDSIAEKWENPATLGTSYGYAKDEEEKDAYKSPTELIHLLCDVVSKNGNLLLNIGPKADGTIPDGMQKRLITIGEWLKINGEAIYNTRPWLTFGEGPTRLKKGGGFTHSHSGYLNYTNQDIRYTRSKDDKTLYVITLGWPDGKTLTLNSVKINQADEGTVKLLGYDKHLDYEINSANQLVITVPELNENERPCQYAYCFAITGFKTSLSTHPKAK